MTALGVIGFVVALLVSVMLHEAGHFYTAKRFGMKATKFFVGFGPTLWSFRRGETEYGVKAIPAGGFVKIVGMTQLEEVEPGDEDRAFWRFPDWQRTVVLSAGSFMHFVIGIALIFAVLVSAGDLNSTHQRIFIASVTPCHQVKLSDTCTPTSEPSPAAAGGVKAGDRLLTVNGHTVTQWNDFTTVIHESIGRPVTLTVARGGSTVTLTVVPKAGVRPKDSGTGNETVGTIGVSSRGEAIQYGILGAIGHTPQVLGSMVAASFKGLAKLPAGIPALVSGKPRDATGPAGVVDIARISGQIATSKADLGVRLGSFLLMIAGLNIFVGIFNLLPLLPLDGGHIAILGFESARSRVARWRRRPDPGRVDMMKVIPVAYAFVFFFIALSLILIYAGFANPIKLTQ